MRYARLSVGLLIFGFFGLAPFAFASVTPTLTLSATGSGDSVQINVTGDPDVNVSLSYTQPGSSTVQQISLGSTDTNGYFSTIISSGTYGLTAGTLVTAVLDGAGGPSSSAVAWPVSTLGLSQNAVVLDVGSSVTVTATNANVGTGALYVSGNSNPSVADESVGGGQVTIQGITAGSTTITVCEDYNSTTCPTLYVLVEGANATQLSFSLNNVSVSNGQSLPITITGGDGSAYEIFKNTNPAAVQASVSGSSVTLSTQSAVGSSSIIICTTDMISCGVVVASAGSVSSSTLSFSSSAPTVAVGASTIIGIYAPAGEQFYISSNSNPSVVGASVSASSVTLNGLSAGSSSITVCASANNCASLTATVPSETTSVGTTSSNLLSQSSLSLVVGQTANVSLSGDGEYNVSNNTGPNIASVSINGSAVMVYGISPGLTDATICEDTNICSVLSISVNNANPQATITPTPVTTPTVVPAPTTTPSETFTGYLSPGSENAQVTALQKVLAAQGFFSASATGYYGTETEDAVIKFQAAHDINQLGVVGPATRAVLNQIEDGTSPSTVSTDTTIDTMTLSQLQAEVQSLQTELSQVLSRISQLQ